MDTQCTSQSAPIYKKPIMRGTAALFTNRKWLKQALCVLFLVCFPLLLFSAISGFSAVFLKLSHTRESKQENCIELSGVIGISVSPLS